jgi:signal transduction histidine kinase
MSVIFADCNPEHDSFGTEIIASADLLLQTGNRACFRFISWLSYQNHSRHPGSLLKDSGRVLSGTTRVPAGLFMNLNKQSHTSPLSESTIDPENYLSAMTERVAGCIRHVIPHPIAIFVPGETPRMYNPGDIPAKHLMQIRNRFESDTQLLTDLLRSSDRLADPHRFSDGSCAFFLPLVHEGALEAVLCLYDRHKQEEELRQQHLVSLEPFCQLTSMFISRTRETALDAGTTQRRIAGASEKNPHSEENPQMMARLVSGLLRTISHDIRTPITTVRGFLKMMLDGRTGPISDPQRDCLKMAFQGVDQLIKIGTSVSDASGNIEQIHAEILDVPVLWQAVMEASRPQLLAKSVTIEESIEGDRKLICGDRQYLTNLFRRLLDCVISAVEDRGKLRVELRCRKEIALMLTFPEVAGSLTPPDADEELASAREIAFLHGGQIALRSVKDGKSILMLALPGYNE